MEYWVIVGEGGGFEEVKSVKSGTSGAQEAKRESARMSASMSNISFKLFFMSILLMFIVK